MLAVYEHIASVIAQKGSEVDDGEEKWRRIAKAWFSCQGWLHTCTVLFFLRRKHSEERSPRNEALMEAVISSVAGSRAPWIIACDRNMEPSEIQKKEKGLGQPMRTWSDHRTPAPRT